MATTITDGNATFKVRDKRERALIDLIYPIGTVYLTEDASFNPNTSWGGTWVQTAKNRVLEGASTNHAAGTTVDAGLPNITGELSPNTWIPKNGSPSGAFAGGTQKETIKINYEDWNETNSFGGLNMDASRSSSIYGKSNTVQPAAEFVVVWKRTA